MRRAIAALSVSMLAGAATPVVAAAPEEPSASLQSSAEVRASFATLRQVDDHPLYEMTYVGDYDPLFNVDVPAVSSFGCSLFAVSGDPDHPLFARNFDWDPDAAMVLHTDPPGGYASIAIVDVRFLGVEPGVDLLTDDAARSLLLNTPLPVIDGMNEEGVAVGLAADDAGEYAAEPGKPTVSGLRIMRLVLDKAATVREAIAVFDAYNLDFTGGPPLHYLVADASGSSAVIEFVGGEMVVIEGTAEWQVLTNFQQSGADDAEFRADRRWSTAADALTDPATTVDVPAALDLLESVAQGHTQWSVVYDLVTGRAHVVTGQRWDTVHGFDL